MTRTQHTCADANKCGGSVPLGLGSRGLTGFTPAGPVLPWPACCVSPYATPEQHSPRTLQRFGTASGRHWTIRRFPSHPLCSETLWKVGREEGRFPADGGRSPLEAELPAKAPPPPSRPALGTTPGATTDRRADPEGAQAVPGRRRSRRR